LAGRDLDLQVSPRELHPLREFFSCLGHPDGHGKCARAHIPATPVQIHLDYQMISAIYPVSVIPILLDLPFSNLEIYFGFPFTLEFSPPRKGAFRKTDTSDISKGFSLVES
jgi:hypothetical protein